MEKFCQIHTLPLQYYTIHWYIAQLELREIFIIMHKQCSNEWLCLCVVCGLLCTSKYCMSVTPLLGFRWFHPHLTRHAADCILIDNAPEGSYLLRPVEDSDHYAVSVK